MSDGKEYDAIKKALMVSTVLTVYIGLIVLALVLVFSNAPILFKYLATLVIIFLVVLFCAMWVFLPDTDREE